MADEADLSDERQQRLLDAAIENAKKKAQVNIEGSGICLVCEGEVMPIVSGNRSIVGRFCSTECRDRYDG